MEYFFAQFYAFIIPVVVIFVAQAMKFARLSIKYGVNWANLFEPGHFPSAHSAFVTSLVLTVAHSEGLGTAVFAIALCFAFITIYDAMRVRMQIGAQGRFINRLVKHIPTANGDQFPRLKEHVGHSATEVMGGIATGVIITSLFLFFL